MASSWPPIRQTGAHGGIIPVITGMGKTKGKSRRQSNDLMRVIQTGTVMAIPLATVGGNVEAQRILAKSAVAVGIETETLLCLRLLRFRGPFTPKEIKRFCKKEMKAITKDLDQDGPWGRDDRAKIALYNNTLLALRRPLDELKDILDQARSTLSGDQACPAS